MILDLVQEFDYWELDAIMSYIKELERHRLRALTEEEVRDEYIGIFGDDE
jgi:hypothetical protein